MSVLRKGQDQRVLLSGSLSFCGFCFSFSFWQSSSPFFFGCFCSLSLPFLFLAFLFGALFYFTVVLGVLGFFEIPECLLLASGISSCFFYWWVSSSHLGFVFQNPRKKLEQNNPRKAFWKAQK